MRPDKYVGALLNNDQSCVFRTWSPNAKEVKLAIVRPEQQILPMSKEPYGYWSTTTNDIKPETQYFFQVDDKKLPDPASRWQPLGVHEASAVVGPAFSWSDDMWKGISLTEMIQYELHVGAFSHEGTFKGVASKLQYLQDLGINTIQLMPVAQFPGQRNWGYDGVYPFAAHHDYGGAMGLKELVNEAHRLGIAVILDVVYNHQGPEGNYFSEYGPYFTERYKTGWGKAINFDDAWCDGVRNFYLQNALMWLDEFHIDGLRLDAVHAIWDFSARHFIQELVMEVRQLEKTSGRKKVLIAEFDLNNPRYINPPKIGGYGLDGQWIDEFHHALHSVVTGEVDGYYEDFGNLSHLTKAIKNSYVYTGEYSKHRKKFFGVHPTENTYDQFVVFAQNHDQIGNRMMGDRLTRQLSLKTLKLVAATVLLSPQVPMLFMGEEYGEENPFQYFISHTDAELVKLVQEGRKKEFSYFNWEGEVPDPYAEHTFHQCKLSWDFASGHRAELLAFYKLLISFRKERQAMQGRKVEDVTVKEFPGKKVISIVREFQSDKILILLNFEKEGVKIQNPIDEVLRPILSSDSTAGLSDTVDINGAVTMSPQSVLVFEF